MQRFASSKICFVGASVRRHARCAYLPGGLRRLLSSKIGFVGASVRQKPRVDYQKIAHSHQGAHPATQGGRAHAPSNKEKRALANTRANKRELIIKKSRILTKAHTPHRRVLRAHAPSNKDKRALTNTRANKRELIIKKNRTSIKAHTLPRKVLRAHAPCNKEKRAPTNAS